MEKKNRKMKKCGVDDNKERLLQMFLFGVDNNALSIEGWPVKFCFEINVDCMY